MPFRNIRRRDKHARKSHEGLGTDLRANEAKPRRALEIIGDIELNDLSPEIREQLYDQIHTLREIVRLLSPDFEEKVIVETAKLGRALSRERFKVCCMG